MITDGDALPQATFRIMSEDGPKAMTTAELFDHKRVVLFAVPGAFTPTCHLNHLPSYINNYNQIIESGIDAIYVTAVNDVFVMNAWQKQSTGAEKIVFLSDGNAEFAKACGLSLDGSGFGLGTRSQRYAMIVRNGVLEKLLVEENPGQASISAADEVLKYL